MNQAPLKHSLGLVLGAVLAGVLVSLPPTARASTEDDKTVLRFIQGLRERGYFDLAAAYLEELRRQPGTPTTLRSIIDYEQAKLTLEEASSTGDVVRRKEMLDQARGQLEAFSRQNPDHSLTPDAMVQLARLLVEQGHLALIMGDEAKDKADKNQKLVEARKSFEQARFSYGKAVDRLQPTYDKFPRSLPENDPRKQERDRIHAALMNAQLQQALADYEQAQTYPVGSSESKQLLDKASAQFLDLHNRYRTQLAGLAARMWQGKCYEEKGELGSAMGIYNELMGHSDPILRPLQRHVGYFRILVMAKRQEHALAADEASRWLETNPAPQDHHSREGLGVLTELAKNILAQVPGLSSDRTRAAAIRRATDALAEVVRFSSPFKAEAVELLRKYKPRAASEALDLANMSYEEASSQADQAIASEEWDRAIIVLRHAVRRADPAKDPEKANLARHTLAYCYYKSKRYYEADVVAEHLARHYPRAGLSPKSAAIGMAALVGAYDTFTAVDRSGDLSRLAALASYTAATWPDTEQADDARITLGQIYQGTGRFAQAIDAYEAVRAKSPKWADARTRAGTAHWDWSRVLKSQETPEAKAQADAEVKKAFDTLNAAYKARRDSGAAASDAGLINNACDIADIDLETGKPKEALALLESIAKGQPLPASATPAWGRLVSTRLRAHVADNQVDQAMADMSLLEQPGGQGTSRAPLYYSLGRLLEKEMGALRERGDSAGLARRRRAYQGFLAALVGSKSGQTYDSLQWAGENMLKLGLSADAGEVFERVLKTYEKDTAFQALPGGRDRLLRTRLKLAAALRGQRKFTEAADLIDHLVKENPRLIEPKFEEAMLSEDKARVQQDEWSKAFEKWRSLALALSRARSKPVEYFEAWYHAAFALDKEGKAMEAQQTLKSVMRLSSSVGGPEMKAKYLELLRQIK